MGDERNAPTGRPGRSTPPVSGGRSARLAPGRRARPQADGDPDFAGDRSGAAEDVAQTDAPENDGWSGAEDNVERRKPGTAGGVAADPHHRGDRRT